MIAQLQRTSFTNMQRHIMCGPGEIKEKLKRSKRKIKEKLKYANVFVLQKGKYKY